MSILQFSKRISKRLFTSLIVFFLTSLHYLTAQVADFDFIISKKCAPSLVTFQNKSTTGGGLTYLWDFDKGSQVFSTEMILEEVFATPGTYDVTLKVIDGTDTVPKTKTVTIFEGPVARFTVSDSIGCAPQSIQLNDNSKQGDAAIVDYFWDFRNGQTYTIKNINTVFANAGEYDIYYRVTDNNGCSADIDTRSKIRLNDKPIADFQASEIFSCSPPLVVEFDNLSAGNGNLIADWDFGNGISSGEFFETVTYSAYGSFDVRLEVTDEFGCTGTAFRPGYIAIGANSGQLRVLANGTEYTDDSLRFCPGKIAFTTDMPADVTKDWRFNYNGVISNYTNQQSVVLEMLDSGRVTVQLIYGENTTCPDTINHTYFIDWIEADFNLDSDYACSLPQVVNSSNTSKNANFYTWYLPDTTSSSEQDINYTIKSYNSHKKYFSHTVNRQSYPFTLVAENNNGCSDTATTVFTTALPVARIMPDKTSGCIPLNVTFSDSSMSDEDIVSWQYLIDDIKVSDNDGQPYVHAFTTEGIYSVQLVIENAAGCYDTSYAITIKAGSTLSPTATITPNIVCPGSLITIENQTAGIPAGTHWNYSIPNVYSSGFTTQTTVSGSIRPEVSGIYPIAVVADYNGCESRDTITDAINIQGPVGSFTKSFECATPLEYTFTSDLDSITSVSWLIDGAPFGDQAVVSYSFPKSGDYTVRHTGIHATTGCVLVKEKRIKVREVEAAIIPQPYACLGDEVMFKADSSIDYINSCYVEGFMWDFDDLLPPRKTYQTSYAYTYADTGLYTVQLQVEGDNGCVDTAETEIRIVAPQPEFTVDVNKGCAPTLEVNFDYTNVAADISSWVWYFDDNSFDTLNIQPTHEYVTNSARYYYPSLVVTDLYGCVGYASTSIFIEKPNAEFQAYDNGKCLGEQVAFNYISRTHDSLLIRFGDGDSSNTSLRHIYSKPGRYDVDFTVYKNGCESTKERLNYVLIEGVEATYSLSDSVFDCYPVTVDFEHLGVEETTLQGEWDFGNGSVSDGYAKTVQYTYTKPGTYLTSLNIISENNCVAEANRKIEITGPYMEFQFNPVNICSGDEVSFLVTDSVDVETFQWIFGDGSTSPDYSPKHIYNAKGQIVPAISVENNNCQVLLSGDTLYVSEVTADFSLPETGQYCQYEALGVDNYSHHYDELSWHLDGELISEEEALIYILDNSGTFNLVLKAVDALNCADSVEAVLIVNPSPEYDITGQTSLCPGSQSSLLVDQKETDWTITWSPANKVANATEFSTSTNIDSTTVFVATVENQFECSTTNSVIVYVGEILDLSRLPIYDTAIYIGQSLQFEVFTSSDDVQYSWSPNNNISCTNCSSPIVSPIESTEYILTISDSCTTKSLVFPVEVIIDFYLEFPSAFTPNGDGLNDTYNYEYDKLSEIDLRIYNRWGTEVYRSTELGEEGWNGEINGELQGVDSYTYYVRAVSEHGYEFEKKGSFSIIQ